MHQAEVRNTFASSTARALGGSEMRNRVRIPFVFVPSGATAIWALHCLFFRFLSSRIAIRTNIGNSQAKARLDTISTVASKLSNVGLSNFSNRSPSGLFRLDGQSLFRLMTR